MMLTHDAKHLSSPKQSSMSIFFEPGTEFLGEVRSNPSDSSSPPFIMMVWYDLDFVHVD